MCKIYEQISHGQLCLRNIFKPKSQVISEVTYGKDNKQMSWMNFLLQAESSYFDDRRPGCIMHRRMYQKIQNLLLTEMSVGYMDEEDYTLKRA